MSRSDFRAIEYYLELLRSKIRGVIVEDPIIQAQREMRTARMELLQGLKSVRDRHRQSGVRFEGDIKSKERH